MRSNLRQRRCRARTTIREFLSQHGREARVAAIVGEMSERDIRRTLKGLARGAAVVHLAKAPQSVAVAPKAKTPTYVTAWPHSEWRHEVASWLQAGVRIDVVVFGRSVPRGVVGTAFGMLLPLLKAETVYLADCELTQVSQARDLIEKVLGHPPLAMNARGMTCYYYGRRRKKCRASAAAR